MPTHTTRQTRSRGTKRSYADNSLGSEAEASASDDEYNPVSENQSAPQRQIKRKQKSSGNSASTKDASSDAVETNHLFIALSSPDCAVEELAREWMESFEDQVNENASIAITELFNLLMKSCGCNYAVQQHDMLSTELAPETVAEIALVFDKQRLHEYPFISHNKNVKFFRKNVVEFFEQIVLQGHENGALYNSDAEADTITLSSPLMTSITAWLFALSASNVRSFRFVSTTIVLAIQSRLCQLATSNTTSSEKLQKNLENAKKTGKKNQRAQERKIALINESIQSTKLQGDTITEYMSDIFLNVFLHRYRDIDPQIRMECLRGLFQWMLSDSETFLLSDYLRYFGWLLSDPHTAVKEEVLHLLTRLYRHACSSKETLASNFRLFTEGFKQQLLNMIWYEVHLGVKTQLLSLYSEIYKLGFLDDSDIQCTILYGLFFTETADPNSGASKVMLELCKLIATYCGESLRQKMHRYGPLLESHRSSHFEAGATLKVEDCLKFKVFASLLLLSHALYKAKKGRPLHVVENMLALHTLIEKLSRHLFQLPFFLFLSEQLIKYMMLDISSVQFEPLDTHADAQNSSLSEELISELDCSSREMKYILMSLVSGLVITSLVKSKTTVIEAESHVSPIAEFSNYVSDLFRILTCDNNTFVVFLHMWSSILVSSSNSRMLNELGSSIPYNEINRQVLLHYLDSDVMTDQILAAYDTYFSIVLKDTERSQNSLMLSGLPGQIVSSIISFGTESLISSLVAEAIACLSLDDLLESFDQTQESVDETQLVVMGRLVRSNSSLSKLSQVQKFCNIGKFIAEASSGLQSTLLEVLLTRIASTLDLSVILQASPEIYLKHREAFATSWRVLLTFIQQALAWKLEDLTYASNDETSQSIDVGLFLEDFVPLIDWIRRLATVILASLREFNDMMPLPEEKNTQMKRHLVELEHHAAGVMIDAAISLKIFYEKFRSDSSLKNFDIFYSESKGLGAFVLDVLHPTIEHVLLELYFIQECRLAKLLGSSLERTPSEAVDYEDFVFFEAACKEEANNTNPDSSSNVSDAQRSELVALELSERKGQLEKLQIWAAEKSLCIYTTKLLSLCKIGGLSESTYKRLGLNRLKLGDLYNEIFESLKEPMEAES